MNSNSAASMLLRDFSSYSKSWSRKKLESFDRLMWDSYSLEDLIRVKPQTIMIAAGMMPDPWQVYLLNFLEQERKRFRLLVNCSRQIGKTASAAALALGTALLNPRSDIVVIARTQRQTSEFVRKVKWYRTCLQNPVIAAAQFEPHSVLELDLLLREDLHKEPLTSVRDAMTMEEYPNGSRIIALPGKSAGAIMGYGVKLLIIDEACWFPDAVYEDIPPMLAATGGSIMALSYGGFKNDSWWDNAWHTEKNWIRIREPVSSCPRIKKEFLREERERLSPSGYERNYECGFVSEEGAYFDPRDVGRAFL